MSSDAVHLPAAAHACIVSRLDFRSRCAVASVNKLYHALVASAAGHERSSCSDSDDEEQLVAELDVDMRLVEEYADEAADPLYKLACCEACPATRFARSLGILIQSSGLRFLRGMKQLTRLELLDPHPYLGQNQLCDQPAAVVSSLASLKHLRSLRITAASPLVDLGSLPTGLQQLELEWFAAVSQQQLHTMCGQLATAAAAGGLPQLSRLTLAAELDPLISKSSSDADRGINQLSALTQLTSVRILRFQQPTPANADSPCHQGYTRVPAVLGQLPQLKWAEVHLCSGHQAQLAPLQHAEAVSLHLTLEREETAPFNRLPSSITLLTGLTELVLTAAEFQPNAAAAAAAGGSGGLGRSSSSSSSLTRYPSGSGLAAAAGMADISGISSHGSSSFAEAPVFDLTPLRHCPVLKRLLVELHGSPGRLHDVRGLQQLVSLQELVLLFKCPALSSLRKLLLGSWHPAVTAAAAAEEEQEGVYDARGSSSTTSSSSGGGGGLQRMKRGAGSNSSGKQQGILARLMCCISGGGDGAMEAPVGHGQAVRPRAVLDSRPYSQRTHILRNSDGSVSGSSEASHVGRATAHVYFSAAEAAAAAAAGGGTGFGTGVCWEGEAVPPEDVALCRDIMSCLRSVSPVFAVGVPPAAQRVAVATNSRLLLRAPQHLAKAQRVEVVAGSVYLQGTAASAGRGGVSGSMDGTSSATDPHPGSSHHSSSAKQPLSRQGSSLHTDVTAAGNAAPSSPRGLFGRGWFGSGSSNNIAGGDAAAASWVEVVQHQALVAHRHLQLLQGAVAQVQAAGGTCTGTSINVSPAVAPHWHAKHHRMPCQVQPHHYQLQQLLSNSSRHWWRAEGGNSAAAVLCEDSGVARWLQQQSKGQLVMLPPAVYPQLVAGPFAAGVAHGAVPGYTACAPGVPQWLEVDEEGDLVGKDVALPVSVVTRAGVPGDQVVQQLLAEVDQDCFTFFS